MPDKRNNIRRSDRAESEIEFLEFVLDNTISCTIAVHTEEFPLIHSTFFVYDKEQNEIIFHLSKHGFGGSEIFSGKKIAISIYKYGKLYTAQKAVDFGCEYQSVIVYGVINRVEEETEKRAAMELFFNRFFSHIPTESYQEFSNVEAHPIFVVKVAIDQWFGKQHLVPEKAIESFYPEVKPVI
ncbi:MAG TPA: pyridoxamine 5'-phosphate oxidase family protein [Saprospiraceae bacterium]|nr:pyridoxamine 5'-phosphate oxidase family protein [Saprospiraceae bacterium]